MRAIITFLAFHTCSGARRRALCWHPCRNLWAPQGVALSGDFTGQRREVVVGGGTQGGPPRISQVHNRFFSSRSGTQRGSRQSCVEPREQRVYVFFFSPFTHWVLKLCCCWEFCAQSAGMIVFTGSMELVIQPMWHDKVSFVFFLSASVFWLWMLMALWLFPTSKELSDGVGLEPYFAFDSQSFSDRKYIYQSCWLQKTPGFSWFEILLVLLSIGYRCPLLG